MIYKHSSTPSFEVTILLFVGLLVCGDFAFMGLHLLNTFVLGTQSPFFNIERDRGVAEFFQYIKYIWIALLLCVVILREKSMAYISWIVVFLYFLCDDAIKIHESVGGLLVGNVDFVPMFGLRKQDFGELAVSVGTGLILLVPLIFSIWKGSNVFRKTSLDIFFLIGLLVFFGVVVDMFHIALHLSWGGSYLLGLIEDGGEMISVSLLAGYVFLRTGNSQNYFLYDAFMQRWQYRRAEAIS
ncbi:hypothetical protein CA267_000940 [Alteromonas pelagimontana]|uniref:Uncharacterized protein n=1 Tax=Alteromonas pelagimontana TaxID=1858656 RepID=A0A6M4M8H9_9ALTE|nr:hypothetical protein [Alteromonas pelagimontana]QJR79463.1 hypothetical protein CA267_000940 [Alteromonas pelagimontana]